MWVLENTTAKIYAYDLENSQRAQYKDINILDSANVNPSGMWSNSTSFWISDKDKIYSYDIVTNIVATTVSSSQIDVSWATIETATDYILYSSTQSDSGYTEIYSGSNTSYSHTNLETGSGYYYQLSACVDADDSSTCSTRYGTVLLATVPNSDASYTLTFDTVGLASTVSWSVSEGSYFRLSRSTASDSGYTQLYAGNDMTFYDANLVGGVTNYYKLQICSNIDSATCLSLAAAASSSIEFGTPFLGDYAYYAAANADQDFIPSGVELAWRSMVRRRYYVGCK